MSQYILADKHTRKIALASYVMEKRREHMPKVRVRKEVMFTPGEVVETDLDMSSWIETGDIFLVKATEPKATEPEKEEPESETITQQELPSLE